MQMAAHVVHDPDDEIGGAEIDCHDNVAGTYPGVEVTDILEKIVESRYISLFQICQKNYRY